VFRCYEDNNFPLFKDGSYFGGTTGCDSRTGVESIERSGISLKLYPNPNNGSFFMELDQPAFVEIYNPFGLLVFSSLLEKGANPLSNVLSCTGVYILTAKTKDSQGRIKIVRD
jgi:hypothetical protein